MNVVVIHAGDQEYIPRPVRQNLRGFANDVGVPFLDHLKHLLEAIATIDAATQQPMIAAWGLTGVVVRISRFESAI